MGGNWMKKIALMLLMVVGLSGTALAGDKFSLDVGVDYSSRYIWRGMDLISDDNAAVQPWVDAGFSITDKLAVHGLVWADYRLIDGDYGSDLDSDNDWDEFDYVGYLTYDFSEVVSFELGYIYYYLPDGAWDGGVKENQEFYGGVSLALNDYFSTSIYAYYNFDSDYADGIYAKWSLDGATALNEHVELFGSVGFAYMDYTDGVNGASDLPVTVGLSFDLGHSLAMYVSANYCVTFDGIRDNDLNDENEAWLMSGLSFSM